MVVEKEIADFERLQNTPRPAAQAKECFGIVVTFDALGAKAFSIKEAQEFLKLRDKLAIDLPFLQNAIHTALIESIDTSFTVSNEPKHTNALDHLRRSKHEVLTFGDSFILLYECEPQSIGIALSSVASWCAGTISAAIDRNVFLRGALSIGNYLYSGKQSNTVLGPAVADAATWCELADWIGMVVTPASGYYFEQPEINPNELRHHSQFHFLKQQSYIKYHVPLKTGHHENLWTLMWPADFFDFQKPNSIKQHLANVFAGTKMPKGTEAKYANTWKYIDWIWKKSLEWEQKGN